MKKMIVGMALVLASFCQVASAKDAEHVFKFHHFLPPASMAHSKIFVPWAEKIHQESNGRIRIDIYPAMQLGGKPQSLFDQARKGVADMTWTVAGWMPGRFPKGTVFELPFMVTTAEQSSQAIQEYAETEMQDELKGVKLLAVHTHARGSLHSREKSLQTAQDFTGLKVHVANKTMAEIVTTLGASPVFIPVTQVPSSMSKGVIDVSVLPFEVLAPLRLHEMVDYHLELSGDRGLYAQFFIFAMNPRAYNKLPEDLKKVIDDNSGMALAKQMGAMFDEYEAVGRDKAVTENNNFHALSAQERSRWESLLKPITDDWIEDRNDKAGDGTALYEKANALLNKYSQL